MAIRRVTVEEVELRVKGVEKVKKGYDKIDKAQGKLARSSRRTQGAMSRMMKGAGRMGMSFGQAATAAAGFAAALMVVQRAIRALKAPVQLAIDFEKNFAQIKTLSNDVNEEVRQNLLQLAANVPQTAGDVTKAAYQAISAGVAVSDVVPFLAEASKVAVGGATSLTSAVDLLTSATNAFRNQNLTAAEAADSFFMAVKQGKTTIEELNAVFGRGASMAAFGISIDEMNAALAALTKQGMPTAEAMTRLNALVKTIANPVGQVAKGFKALGFEAGVSRLQNEGLIGVLSDLQEKTMGSTVILGTLSRRHEANSAALGLLGDNYRETIKTFEAFSDKVGIASEANDKMADTTQGLINRMSALKEDVLRRMGEEIVPLVNDALEGFIRFLSVHGKELVNTVGSAAKSVMDFGKFIIANKDAIAAGIKTMFAVIAVQLFIASVAAAGTAFAGAMATLAATGASTFMATLGSTLAALAAGGPMLAVMAGIGVALGNMLGDSAGAQATAKLEQSITRIKSRIASAELAEKRARRKAGYATKQEEDKQRRRVAAGQAFMFTGEQGQAIERYQQIRTAEEGAVRTEAGLFTPMQVKAPNVAAAGQVKTVEQAYDELVERVKTQMSFNESLTELEREQFIHAEAEERLARRAREESEQRRQNAEQLNRELQQAIIIDQDNRKTRYQLNQSIETGQADDIDEAKKQLKQIDEQLAANKIQLERSADYVNGLKKAASIEEEVTKVTQKRGREIEQRLKYQAQQEKKSAEMAKLAAKFKAAKTGRRKDGGGRDDSAARLQREAEQRLRFEERQRMQAERARVQRGIKYDPMELFEIGQEGVTEAEQAMEQRLAQEKAKAKKQFDALKGTEQEKADALKAMDLNNLERRLLAEAELKKQAADVQQQLDIQNAELYSQFTGLTAEAEIMKLDQDLQRKKDLYDRYGKDTTELEVHYSNLRRKIAEDERKTIESAVRQSNMDITGSIGTTISAISEVAEAAGASREVMAVLEAGQIIAKGVYHKFMAGSEFANAASAAALAFGGANPIAAAKAKAHTAAGIMHTVQAGAAAVQAGIALAGGFGGGGGRGSAGGGAAAGLQYQQPANAGRLADRERDDQPAAAIQFGDIVLSDVPALFSRAGINALGQSISGSVVEAINRQNAIPGGARLSRRSSRR